MQIIYDLYFGVLQPVACTLSRLLEEPSLATTFQGVYLYFISPQHVSALTGHFQAENTIIFGKLPHYNGSDVLCHTSTTGEDDMELSFMKNYVQCYVLIQRFMFLTSIF
jgi:hypothetical protein